MLTCGNWPLSSTEDIFYSLISERNSTPNLYLTEHFDKNISENLLLIKNLFINPKIKNKNWIKNTYSLLYGINNNGFQTKYLVNHDNFCPILKAFYIDFEGISTTLLSNLCHLIFGY